MLKFNFLNLAKPKKVFEKLNKMDRKQAYTVGAIVVVAVVALLMLVSSLESSGDPMDGMSPRGYDLAAMPFVSDLAEKQLLASAYPDMRENGSTLLYTPLERQQRQEEDQAQQEAAGTDMYELVPLDTPQAQPGETTGGGAASAGLKGSGRGGGYGGAGDARTEIGKLEKGGMAASGGSGVGSFYGPTGDFRQLNKSEHGYVAPAQLKTDNARNTLSQFRTGSFAANRLRDNKNANARKAMMGGHVQGSQAVKGNGIDASKLGGLALDTSELPKTTDLGNLDDAVDNAVKEHEPPAKPEDKLGFWEQLGQDLLRQAASNLVDAVTTGVGDSIKGWVNGNSASRAAGKKAWAEMQGKSWNELSASQRAMIEKGGGTKNGQPTCNATTWGTSACKATYGNTGKYLTAAERYQAYADKYAGSIGSTKSAANTNTTQQHGQTNYDTCYSTCLGTAGSDCESRCQSLKK